ncbi:MAG: tetratricopeptide repeat protein, partial [Alicyclobacillus sp.]|nr:tetratricopeptide repeat protein [Alicyclobacillus sp.]
KRGDWHDAVNMWEAASALCGTYHLKSWQFYAHWHHGLALTRIGFWEEAIEILLPLLIDPSFHENPDVSYEILRGLGMSTRNMGQVNQSILFFRLALHLLGPTDHRWISTQINLATNHGLLGDYESASRTYKLAIDTAKELGEGLLEAWALIGWTTAQLHTGKTENCAEALERAERLGAITFSDDVLYSVRHNRLVLRRLSGEWEQFERDYSKLIKDVPNDEWKAQLLEEKIIYETQRENWQQADAGIREALNLSVTAPVRARVLIAAGKSYAERKMLDKAKTLLLQALEIMRTTANREVNDLYAYIESLR